MAAYELFAATTTNLFIQNIKNKAEAYGWTIDFFGLYSGNNRLHLHNARGAHFEIWYAGASTVNVRGCTGYSSSDIPTSQPGVSGNCQIQSSLWHFIVVGSDSIYIKSSQSSTYSQNFQFGTIVKKVGEWTGGTCLSTAQYNAGGDLWSSYSAHPNQVLINGSWTTLSSTLGGGVRGVCESDLYTKMPFAYSGGILPVPMLLVQFNPTTPVNLHPIGYAPDFMSFAGGDVYSSLTPVTINGENWLPFNRQEIGSITATSPADTLIRLAA